MKEKSLLNSRRNNIRTQQTIAICHFGKSIMDEDKNL